MKGQFCEEQGYPFCQEDSGCDNCTVGVSPRTTYKAIVEIHNLRRIETEPMKLAVMKEEYLPELVKRAGNFIRDNAPKLLGGFAITVTYSKEG